MKVLQVVANVDMAKKAEDATNAKMLTDIEKQREAQDKAAAQKSEAEPASAPAEGATGEEKAEDKAPAAAGKAAAEKPSSALKLTLPEQGRGGKPAPGASANLVAGPKRGKPEKAAADSNVRATLKKKAPAEKAAAEEKPAEQKSDKNSAEKPAAE